MSWFPEALASTLQGANRGISPQLMVKLSQTMQI
jgi:hypothetical protein